MRSKPSVLQLPVGPMKNFSYVLFSEGEAAIIDPGWDSDEIVRAVAERRLSPRYVLLTHSHYDHVQELGSVVSAFKGIISIAYCESSVACHRYVSEQETLPLGSETLRFLHTPGHVPESMCIIFSNHIFTGDTLFVGSIGRTDLPGGNPRDMQRSLKRLSRLDHHLVVWPGHDYGLTKHSTIGYEVAHNTNLKSLSP